jgi:hypothetical protein
MKLEKYKVKMKQADLRNIPPCYLRNAIDAMPSLLREIIRSAASSEEGDKFKFGDGYVKVSSDAVVEIHGLTPVEKERILSKLKIFDVQQIEP